VSNSDHHVARPERLLPLPQRCCCRGVSGAIGSAPGCGQGQSPRREADEGGHHGSSRSNAEQPVRSQTPVRDACNGICELCAPSQLRIAPHLTLAEHSSQPQSPHREETCVHVRAVCECVCAHCDKTHKHPQDKKKHRRHTVSPESLSAHCMAQASAMSRSLPIRQGRAAPKTVCKRSPVREK
jgi:hypothetical protein